MPSRLKHQCNITTQGDKRRDNSGKGGEKNLKAEEGCECYLKTSVSVHLTTSLCY